MSIQSVITDVYEKLSLLHKEGCTPKELRSSGGTVGPIQAAKTAIRNADSSHAACHRAEEALDAAEEELQDAAWNAKAKAKNVLGTLLDTLRGIEDSFEAAQPGCTSRLEEIQGEIQECMQTASKALVKIGELLTEARTEFDKAPEFLSWALDSFGFKKAYVYRLMTAAKQVKEAPELRNCSIKVLHIIAGLPEEVKKEVRDTAKAGEDVTPTVVKELAGGKHKESEAPDTTADLGQGDTGAPWDSGTGTSAPGSSTAALVSDPSEEVKRLTELVQELKAELAAARQERAPKAKPQAPMLPQFQSSCMYARLGLSYEQGQSAADVRKAFRALVKAGYSSQHEAYPLLLEAKEHLERNEEKVA